MAKLVKVRDESGSDLYVNPELIESILISPINQVFLRFNSGNLLVIRNEEQASELIRQVSQPG